MVTDDTKTDKQKFNEERIKAWKAQRMAVAEQEAAIRREQAAEEKKERIERFKHQRQEELKAIKQDKKALALEQLPTVENIYQIRQNILLEQQQRKRQFIKRLAAVLLGSFILTLLYTLFSTSFYEAQSVVTIKTNSLDDNKRLSSILPSSVSPNVMQAIFAAREYILSRDMMNKMQQEAGFVSYFKTPDIGFLSRPGVDRIIGQDDYYYYKHRIKVAVDIQEGLMRIQIQAKNETDAKAFANTLLSLAERWVNTLSNRMFEDKIQDAQNSLNHRKRSLEAARQGIVKFQIAKGDLNPRETVAAIYKNLDDIAFKTKQTEREIATYKRASVAESPIVAQLQSHLAVLHQQTQAINKGLIDTGQWSMNKILSSYEHALMEKEVAEKEWEVALKALEDVKLEVFNQKQYVLTIVPPITSPLPVEPKPLKFFILIALISYGLLSAISLIKATLKLSSKN